MVSTPSVSRESASELADFRQGSREAQWVIPLVLCVIYVVECAWFIRTQSLTFDEPVHVTAGLEAWREGRFARWNDHPPLQRLLCTLPLLSSKYQIMVEGQPDAYHVTDVKPDPQSLAWRGRSVSVILGVILAWLLWSTANSTFSRTAANFVLALFVFSPAAIAHFSMITTDGAGTLMIFGAALQLVRWRRSPSWPQTAFLGAVLGLLLLAKFYTPPMFLIAVAWMLVLTPDSYALHPRRLNWRKTAAAVAIAFFVLWAGYFFHVSRLTIRHGELTATFPNRDEPTVKKVHSPINLSIPVPAGEYLEGLRIVALHNHRGHRSYFLGQVSEKGGWKSYYPFVMSVKWPTVVLFFIAAGIVVAVLKRRQISGNALVMASFPLVFLVFAIFSKIDIGDRHILPLYPFALLLCGLLWHWAEARRAVLILLLLGVVLHAADTFRYAPGYISYFNLFVKKDQGYKLLSDSNVDWGQGLLAVKKYEDEHPGTNFYLVYWGSMDPQLYGVHSIPLLPGDRPQGIVMVSATALTGQFLADPDRYRWLEKFPSRGSLDHALLIFDIPQSSVPETRVEPH